QSAHPVFPVTLRRPPSSALFPYTTLFRSRVGGSRGDLCGGRYGGLRGCSGLGASTQTGHGKSHPRQPVQSVSGHFEFSAQRLVQIGRDTSELQSREKLVCRLLLEKKQMNI